MDRAMKEASLSLNLSLVLDDIISDSPELSMCPLLNISQCAVSTNFQESLTVNIYNQLSRVRVHVVRIPVTPGSYQVKRYLQFYITFFCFCCEGKR